jgi:starch-binding outer membrane protein, SusD/RagB family
MKKNKLYHIVLAGLLAAGTVFTGCEKSIDVDVPGGQITKDSVIRNEADLNAVLNSTYTALGSSNYWGGRYQVLNELMADGLSGTDLSGEFASLFNRNTSIFGEYHVDFYAEAYIVILRANTLLENLDKATGANRSRLEGEARFLRGLCHFDVVRLFGQPFVKGSANNQLGVPLRTKSEPTPVTRNTVGEVYAQIISDLRAADSLLPVTNSVYPTRWAAKALLARVYFQMNDFANAYRYANEVIASTAFTFETDLAKRFSKNPGSRESVFQLIYETNNPQGRFNQLRDQFSFVRTAPAVPTMRMTADFYSRATTTNDRRKAWYKVQNTFNICTKYDSLVFRLPIIHLTELKLIRAESAAETGTNLNVGIQDINDIINRAYSASAPVLATTATAAQLKDAVRRERELEMAFEGDRLQELKRRGGNGENVTIRSAPWNCNGLALVFPTTEINVNPGFQQNPSGGCQ